MAILSWLLEMQDAGEVICLALPRVAEGRQEANCPRVPALCSVRRPTLPLHCLGALWKWPPACCGQWPQ